MKIVQDYPPNIEAIRSAFTLHKGIIFTYGDTIYNPHRSFIDEPLMSHEEVHCKQQGDDPAAWWDRYLIDHKWRVRQEIAAYRMQFKSFKQIIHGRERRHAYLCAIAGSLSSPMYGNAISFVAAAKAIRHGRAL